jgi:RNA polymerase sigma-70 factor, ECF subfamily
VVLATTFSWAVSELYKGARHAPWTPTVPLTLVTVHAMPESRGERAPLAKVGREADAVLVDACRQGDRRAMEALYHRFKRRVFSMVARIAGPQDAEEVSQEVFMRIYRGLLKFRGESALDTWVYRLTVNAAVSHVSRRPARAEGEEALAHVPSQEGPARDPRLAARLETALVDLPAGYRAVLVLHDIEGLSHEEIAEILGCRVGTSKSQLHKARSRMRELLGMEGVEE